MKIRNRLKDIGPAALVTAAFIGPGTLTTCTLAGSIVGILSIVGSTLFNNCDHYPAEYVSEARDYRAERSG
jgi:Mn2+/Fe2+ NRAMP family transporter